MPKLKGLSVMEEAFCRAYVFETNGNAAEAARIAGYSESSAVQGYKILQKPRIAAEVRALTFEHLRAKKYEPELVREIAAERLLSCVMTRYTDVVLISPDRDDPDRGAALDALAEANGGQRLLDFGEILVVPSPYMPETAKGAIKSVRKVTDARGNCVSLDVEMHDPIASARVLASLLGIGNADTEVSVTVGLSEGLEQARKREAAAGDA